VVWRNMNQVFSCASIGGYIDMSKRYVVYENDKWISDI